MLKSNPLVSVIMPVYNGAEFVGCALESILLQTHRHIEVIVVNDGSTDSTQEILEAYAARDPRIRVIQQPNAGVARARNRAIAESTSEFIAPIDADDLWAPDKISRQLSRMLAGGDSIGIVYSWWAWIGPGGEVLDRSPRWTVEGAVFDRLMSINFMGNASVPLFRRRCLEEAGGYNEKLAAAKAGGCEDWEVALHVAAKHRVAVAPEILVGYRRRPGSMSTALDTMWRSWQHVIEGLRGLRPGLKPALIQASQSQFAMYLAGLAYRSGDKLAACKWASRAGLILPLLVAPHVMRMVLFPRRKEAEPQRMMPGRRLNPTRVPEPDLPYDWVGTPFPVRAAQRLIYSLFLTRLRLEYLLRARSTTRKKSRVWTTACFHFPIYSQTFVYREVVQLLKAGFDVRFAYTKFTSRLELPDDSAALWRVRRRVPLFKCTAGSDLAYYQRLMPQRLRELALRIAEESGLSEEGVYAHPHFRNACTFTRMAQAWHPGYIHTYFFQEQTLYGLVASTLLDIPRGVSCYADHMLRDYEQKMVGLHMRTCDVVVATSMRIKSELEEIAGDPLAHAMVKPNGIDASQYAPQARRPSGPSRVFKLVAVNRIHPKKGMSYLLEASVLLRQRGLAFVVDILGDSDAHDPSTLVYSDQLKQYVAANGLEKVVRFHGMCIAAKVRGYLAEADLFIAPYIELENGDKDGIPTALLEGMAAGCAVVVTDAGSITEVVRDGLEGVVVPQRDARALADAIERLAGDDAHRAQLSSTAIERVRQAFDVNQCEHTFHDAVREAIAKRDPFRSMVAGECRPGALKIALLSYEYPPETGFGGIGTYTWYQARALARLGHRVHVVAGSETSPLRIREHDGVFVYRYRSGGIWLWIAGCLGTLGCFWSRQRILSASSTFVALRQLMEHFDYDIIEMPECGAEGAWVTLLMRFPTVVRLHGPAQLIMPFYSVPLADKLLSAWIEQITIRRASGLSSCSHFLAEEVTERLAVKKPVEVIYNGIDLPLFDAESVADLAIQYGVPQGQTTILFTGRMERRKGIHLCGAIAEIVLRRRDVTFLFAGDDPYGDLQQMLLPLIEQRGLLGSVRYLGKLSFQQLRACARAVDIYLLPSLWENCPYACLEAMAAGRAIVCSGQGGMPELIEHGVNGLVAETGSPESFAAHLEALIDEPELRIRLGLTARETIEQRFTDTSVALQTAMFYRKTLEHWP